jgi:hypothetical protein
MAFEIKHVTETYTQKYMNIKYALHKVYQNMTKHLRYMQGHLYPKVKPSLKWNKLKLNQNVRSDVLMVVWDYDHSQN